LDLVGFTVDIRVCHDARSHELQICQCQTGKTSIPRVTFNELEKLYI